MHQKDVLKYATAESGERYVAIILITQKRELFVSCSDTDMSAK